MRSPRRPYLEGYGHLPKPQEDPSSWLPGAMAAAAAAAYYGFPTPSPGALSGFDVLAGGAGFPAFKRHTPNNFPGTAPWAEPKNNNSDQPSTA